MRTEEILERRDDAVPEKMDKLHLEQAWPK